MTVGAEGLRETTPRQLRTWSHGQPGDIVKENLKCYFDQILANFDPQCVPAERPDRKYFFARRIGPYKQPGQKGKLKSLDLNCSVRLTTREYVYIYTEDNIDEGNQGDDENEDFENEDEWEEMEDKEIEENEEKSEINRIIADREEAGIDEEEEEVDFGAENDEEDDEDNGDEFVIVQSAFRNDRKQHMINESVEPNLLRYPLHYKVALDKLAKLGKEEYLPLVDFELPAEEAIQFAVSLWAEGLLEPKE